MKKLIKALLIFSILVVLSGCQLASEDDKKLYHQPQVVGFYFTVDDSIKGKVNGIKENDQFVFPGYEGISMFEYFATDDKGESMILQQIDPAVLDFGCGAIVGGTLIHDCTGTLYFDVTNENKNMVFIPNLVYQEVDGNVYVEHAVSGLGYDFGPEFKDKSIGSYGIDDEVHKTTNNEIHSFTFQFKIMIIGKFKADTYVAHQMNVDNQIISSIEFNPNHPPTEIIKEDNLEYILLESRVNFQDKDWIDRTIVAKEESNLPCYKVNKLGFLEPVNIPLK